MLKLIFNDRRHYLMSDDIYNEVLKIIKSIEKKYEK